MEDLATIETNKSVIYPQLWFQLDVWRRLRVIELR